MTNYDYIQKVAYDCLIQLSNADGIYASGREEAFGCIFGRDSFLTISKILNFYTKNNDQKLLDISKNALLNLTKLQGKEINIESGEEPGKFIHEFRKEKYEHLLACEKPWYIYPDGYLRNYDSIDSTPLGLITIHKYWQISGDKAFINEVLPAVKLALEWIIKYGDKDHDTLLEYEFSEQRTHGGLTIQSWTDSHESLATVDNLLPKYPIAPVEVQAYAWLALKLWGKFFADIQTSSEFDAMSNTLLSQQLLEHADKLKSKFNELFIISNNGLAFTAQALDGDKNKINTITGNTLLLLWASYQGADTIEAIVDKDILKQFVERGFQEDLFDADAGIRTMSVLSTTFNPNEDSYHNGSFWPILNGLVHEGLIKWKFYNYAKKLKDAALIPLDYFKSPIELYIKKGIGVYVPYRSPSGQESCKQQAWSAAAVLDLISSNEENEVIP